MENRGFTLIELIMVIVIVGILAAIAIPKFIDLRVEARQAECRANGQALSTAISNYYASAVLASPGNPKHWPSACASAVLGGYMQTWPSVPTSGIWNDAYTSINGVLNLDAACPK